MASHTPETDAWLLDGEGSGPLLPLNGDSSAGMEKKTTKKKIHYCCSFSLRRIWMIYLHGRRRLWLRPPALYCHERRCSCIMLVLISSRRRTRPEVVRPELPSRLEPASGSGRGFVVSDAFPGVANRNGSIFWAN